MSIWDLPPYFTGVKAVFDEGIVTFGGVGVKFDSSAVTWGWPVNVEAAPWATPVDAGALVTPSWNEELG